MIIRLPTPTRCQHIGLRQVPASRVAGHGMRLVPVPCQAQPCLNDYCDLHQAGAEIMKLGRDHGYPTLSVNNSLEIGYGKANWEAYAIVATPERVKQIKVALEAR